MTQAASTAGRAPARTPGRRTVPASAQAGRAARPRAGSRRSPSAACSDVPQPVTTIGSPARAAARTAVGQRRGPPVGPPGGPRIRRRGPVPPRSSRSCGTAGRSAGSACRSRPTGRAGRGGERSDRRRRRCSSVEDRRAERYGAAARDAVDRDALASPRGRRGSRPRNASPSRASARQEVTDAGRVDGAAGLEGRVRRLATRPTPGRGPSSSRMQAEALGFESLWVFDHFHTVPDPTDEITFESFSMLDGPGDGDEARPPRPHGRLHGVPQPGPDGQAGLDARRHQRRPVRARDRRRLEGRRVAGLRLRLPDDR